MWVVARVARMRSNQVRGWASLVTGVVAVLALAGPAVGAALRITSVSRSLHAGGSGHLTVRVPYGTGACELVVKRGGKSLARRRMARAPERARVTWSWRVFSDARAGRWVVQARCATAGSVAAVVTVRGPRTGRPHLAYRVRVRQSGARLRGPDPPVTAPPLPPPPLSAPPRSGQCTTWAAYKRPDIPGSVARNVAADWSGAARAAGFPVDGTVRVGDVAVWPRFVGGALLLGHVAYVESVDPGGTFDVSEMNWGCNECFGHREALAPAGLQFIHRKT
ncbi:MAG: peptidoglycan DL-endopeptidase CwlO [Solirubrobacteraceae bacterium]|nr:peptidoglycan DL-endopeptidase CwlO [Solirubrobacteraceae bacterium]